MSVLELGTSPVRAAVATADADAWPHTRRLLPWMLALFLTMVFLVPFDSIQLRMHLPADATLDRVLLVAILSILLFRTAVIGRSRRPRRLTAVECAVLLFGAIALLSIVLNVARIYQLNQFTYAEKQFAQLLSYIAFFFIVVSVLRVAEMTAFARLVLALASLTAVGTLYEAHTGVNLFYMWSGKLLSPIALVPSAPTNINPANGPLFIVGPTQHGLALASLLTMALPFAVLPLFDSRRWSQRLPYLTVIGLILAADLSTHEKTAVIAPVAVFVTLMAYKRQLLRWAPLMILVLIPVIHFAAPGALGSARDILPTGGGADYTDGRASDYAAVAPDILSNLVIGRGYGTLDPLNWRWYRILDNQYLDELFTMGIVGLAAYLAIIVSALGTAHRVIKRGGVRAPAALAAAAGCASFGVLSATFDAAGYPQSVYSFMFAAGMIVVAATEPVASAAPFRLRLFHFSRYWSRAVGGLASPDA